MVMDPIEISKRKPRRTHGTPSFHYRNRFAYALIAAGTAVFGIWCLTPIYHIANDKIVKSWLPQTEVEKDRRGLFEFGPVRTSKSIQETIDNRNQVMSER